MKKIPYIKILGLGVIGIVIYLIINDIRKRAAAKKLNNNSEETPKPQIGQTANNQIQIYKFTSAEKSQTLKKGVTGQNVKALQIFLNLYNTSNTRPKLVLDGIFGDLTEAELMRYNSQTETNLNNLDIDGIYQDKIYKSSFFGGGFNEIKGLQNNFA